ncbi:MAG: hypothetical protein IJU25_08475 [Lachnospiraceae bacterium]|nr:hypothetical protein [Lachnospiraceae bacterium]
MYFELKYDDENLTGLMIRPGETEDPDVLHNYAQMLKIKNVAIAFSDLAKEGGLNDMPDKEYVLALKRVKIVSGFFNDQPSANVFHILAEAIRYILREGAVADEEDALTDEEAEDTMITR